MKKLQYNKLVRDNIPEIIDASGKTCRTEILSDDEYLKMLDSKLDTIKDVSSWRISLTIIALIMRDAALQG